MEFLVFMIRKSCKHEAHMRDLLGNLEVSAAWTRVYDVTCYQFVCFMTASLLYLTTYQTLRLSGTPDAANLAIPGCTNTESIT